MESGRFPNFIDYLKSCLKNRNLYAGLLTFILVAMLLVRLFQLQIKEGGAYAKAAEKTVVSTENIVIKAKRGNIYDRNGILLAGSRSSYQVEMVNYNAPQSVRDLMYLRLIELFQQNGDTYINHLNRYITPELEWGSSLAGEENESARSNWINTIVSGHKKSDRDGIVTAKDAFYYLRDTVFKLDGRYTDEECYKIMILRYETYMYGLSYLNPTVIASDASADTAEYISARYFDFPGISTSEVYFRTYNDAYDASHILGYVRAISSEEYEALKDSGYSQDDIIGKIGIEKAAESYLRGTDGIKTLSRNINEGTVEIESYIAPRSGDDVFLTIDYPFQQKCASILTDTIKDIAAAKNGTNNFGDACAASCVVEKVSTGEILAMVSVPGYDNSIFIAPSTDKEAQSAITALFTDPAAPSLNRATQGLYPVGSTIKPAISVAALMSKTISADRTVKCERTMTIGGRTHSCLSKHGTISLVTAIAKSCNIYFYTVGIETGIETIDSWLAKFGLGEKTGIEISEYAGNRSNPETMKEKEKDSTHKWSDSDTAQTSIGQLYTLFTPLQLANYVSSIANGGYLNSPHLIDNVIDSSGRIVATDEEKCETKTEIGISSYVLKVVREGMTEMVKRSTKAQTAFASFPDGFIAAKTGTPQTGLEAFGQSSHSVLICYAPADKPEIAMAIVIEHGASGSNSLQAAAKIFEAYFNSSSEVAVRSMSGNGYGWEGIINN